MATALALAMAVANGPDAVALAAAAQHTQVLSVLSVKSGLLCMPRADRGGRQKADKGQTKGRQEQTKGRPKADQGPTKGPPRADQGQISCFVSCWQTGVPILSL